MLVAVFATITALAVMFVKCRYTQRELVIMDQVYCRHCVLHWQMHGPLVVLHGSQ